MLLCVMIFFGNEFDLNRNGEWTPLKAAQRLQPISKYCAKKNMEP